MKNVNPELYDFLKENETGLYTDWRLQETIAYVHIHFSNLADFVRIIGNNSYFNDGGIQVLMFSNTICIEINDIIGGLDHSLCNYKDCFDKDVWKEYEEQIIKEWKE
jgi:hypothetical protein